MLFDKRLEVNFSKHSNITTGADTHEYSNSNLNRFNRNATKNYRYCCSPTKMVHLSSLPQDVTEEEIAAHLEEHGTIVNLKLFDMNGKKQALILFETMEQATEALVCKHVTSLGGSIIRISFSQLQTIWDSGWWDGVIGFWKKKVIYVELVFINHFLFFGSICGGWSVGVVHWSFLLWFFGLCIGCCWFLLTISGLWFSWGYVSFRRLGMSS